jgi:hypothetical protein
LLRRLFSPVLPKDYFFPDAIDGGNTLAVTVKLFNHPNRKVKAKRSTAGFNEAQSFKSVHDDIEMHYNLGDDNEIGAPTSVTLPFTCEEWLTYWKVKGYKNKLGDLTDTLGEQQFNWCLTVTVRKLVNKIRVRGGFRIVDSGDEGDMDT